MDNKDSGLSQQSYADNGRVAFSEQDSDGQLDTSEERIKTVKSVRILGFINLGIGVFIVGGFASLFLPGVDALANTGKAIALGELALIAPLFCIVFLTIMLVKMRKYGIKSTASVIMAVTGFILSMLPLFVVLVLSMI